GVGGVGEFSGDAYQDVLLENARTGALKLWEVQGGSSPSVRRTTDLGFTVPAGWDLTAVADYDGNGTPDLFLQDRQTGRVAVWSLNRLQVIGQGNLRDSFVQGTLVGVGDLNGDGAQDLLRQQKDGT